MCGGDSDCRAVIPASEEIFWAVEMDRAKGEARQALGDAKTQLNTCASSTRP